jgi:hypothetical protein
MTEQEIRNAFTNVAANYNNAEEQRKEAVEALRQVMHHCVTPKGFPDAGNGRTPEQQAAFDKAKSILNSNP